MREWYDKCIPVDKPLDDELHIKHLYNYHDQKHGDLEYKAGSTGKRLGAPIATEDKGILP